MEKEMAQPTPGFLSGEIPWTDEPGGRQSRGLQKSQAQLRDYATYFDPQSCEYDLLPWVRLANCIDRQFEVTCENDGNVEKAICIQDPDGRYTCADDWNRYADPKYIKEIKPIEL